MSTSSEVIHICNFTAKIGRMPSFWNCVIFLVTILVLSFVIADPTLENKCKADTFPAPYVILYSSRNGPEVAKLQTQGVIDLRERIRAFVCINGPVIVYSDSDVMIDEDNYNAPGTLSHVANINPGETVKFSNGTLKIYNHKCLSINIIPRSSLNKMEALGIKPSIDASVTVKGMKATGIFLITSEEPFDPSKPSVTTTVMFNQIGYGYEIGSSENIISDASFITIGQGPFCLTLNDSSIVVLVSASKNDQDVCGWTVGMNDSPGKDYKRAFRKQINKAVYKWEPCPADIMTTAPATTGSGTIVSKSGSFNLLNPQKFTPHGSRKGGKLSGGDEWPPPDGNNDNDISKTACSMKPGDPTCDEPSEFSVSKEEEEDPSIPPKNIFLNMENCSLLPSFNPSDPSCGNLGIDTICAKLIVALELDPSTADPTSAAATPSLSLLDNHRLVWKHQVLSLIGNIFSKICLPIKMETVFRVLRLVGSFIAAAHTNVPETSEYSHLVNQSHTWEILMSSLKRCNESRLTLPMEWDWPEKPEPLDSNKILPFDEEPYRKKRAVHISSEEIELATFVEDMGFAEVDEEDTRSKLIIQRSSPVFQYDDKDEFHTEFVPGTIPRWRRTSPGDEWFIPYIQEYDNGPGPATDSNGLSYDDFIFHPDPDKIRVKHFPDKEIFYYEEVAELDLPLNGVIDAWWKILTTVIGYCQINEKGREFEIYPLLFHNFNEYFLALIKDKWTSGGGGIEANILLGELSDEDRSRWLDTCLETAYIAADIVHLRPARPLDFEGKGVEGVNCFVEMPENMENPDGSQSSKYFTRKKP